MGGRDREKEMARARGRERGGRRKLIWRERERGGKATAR